MVFPGETMSGSSFAPGECRSCSSMNPIAIRAIEAMVAPVVLITTVAILSGGILSMYGSVNDRTMNRERLESLTSDTGTFLSVSVLPASSRERLAQIDIQLPMLLNPSPFAEERGTCHIRRHRRPRSERHCHRSGGDERLGPGWESPLSRWFWPGLRHSWSVF